jgi:hypothetical protein
VSVKRVTRRAPAKGALSEEQVRVASEAVLKMGNALESLVRANEALARAVELLAGLRRFS